MEIAKYGAALEQLFADAGHQAAIHVVGGNFAEKANVVLDSAWQLPGEGEGISLGIVRRGAVQEHLQRERPLPGRRCEPRHRRLVALRERTRRPASAPVRRLIAREARAHELEARAVTVRARGPRAAVVVDDDVDRLGKKPSVVAPGGTDGNATLTAVAVVPTDYDPCADESFISCPSGLTCSADADGNVTGSWSAPATVSMYFTEACCTNRHFKIALQGAIVDDDVSYLDYHEPPDLGRTGRLS